MNIENLCEICREKSSPYKCPKCQLKYCSLICYRDVSHEKCAEEFDTESTSKTTTTNNFVRQRIDEIFKRKLDEKDFHDENDDEDLEEFFVDRPDDDEVEDEHEEEKVELPDDLDESDEKTRELWEMLTGEEQREFLSMIKDGRISHLLNDYKPWKPWWLFKTTAPPLITDVNVEVKPLNFPSTIPKISHPIVPLPSLTSILPHPNVRFDLFEILFGYALINVRYRGEFSSYLNESSNEFLPIATRHFDASIDENFQLRISFLRKTAEEISEEFFLNLFEDVQKIVHGPFQRENPSNLFVLSALSDLKRFLDELHRSTKKKLLQNLRRKIDFFLSWTVTYADRLKILDDELEQMEKFLRHRCNEFQTEKLKMEKNLQKIRFEKIEEL